MPEQITVLIMEDEPGAASELRGVLSSMPPYSPVVVRSDISVRHVEGYNPQVAIVGGSSGFEHCMKCVQKLKIADPGLPILVFVQDKALTGGALNGPFEGIFSLAIDYDLKELKQALDHAIEQRPGLRKGPEFPVLIGNSPEVQKIRDKIKRIADKDITVLITGESGTGKELIARSIHYHSRRKNGPLLKITCGALPDDLLESEVFGFQRGAFTGAHRNKPGRLELAHGGTLFVDEIGDLSLQLQVKFLQVLEDKSFSRLGGVEDKLVDARVIAATNTDLWKMVREGTFRKDLYYRLNVVNIEAPPLRKRREDIPLLVDYFLNKYCYELRREPLEVPAPVLRTLTQYAWPGNVRELENVVRRAIVLREWDFVYKELDLDLHLDGEDVEMVLGIEGIPGWIEGKVRSYMREQDFSLKAITKRYVSEVEKRAILKTLEQTRWNRRKAASLLGVSYKTLLNRIAEFNLKPTV